MSIETEFPEEYARFKAQIEASGGTVEDAEWKVNPDFYEENGWLSTSISVTTVNFTNMVIVKRPGPEV